LRKRNVFINLKDVQGVGQRNWRHFCYSETNEPMKGLNGIIKKGSQAAAHKTTHEAVEEEGQ